MDERQLPESGPRFKPAKSADLLSWYYYLLVRCYMAGALLAMRGAGIGRLDAINFVLTVSTAAILET